MRIFTIFVKKMVELKHKTAAKASMIDFTKLQMRSQLSKRPFKRRLHTLCSSDPSLTLGITFTISGEWILSRIFYQTFPRKDCM